jgi:serine/threonine protein kinase
MLNNRYQISQEWGKGGFGQTFLAIDTRMPNKRKCVVKLFQPARRLDSEIFKIMQERFEREAAILEKLGDSNEQIPRLYDYFLEAGEFYLVQEFIEGKTIKQKLKEDGPFSENSVREIMGSLLSVLENIHSQGIIHRDINPNNIILRSKDGKPVLIDFGAVKEVITTVVDSYGTPIQPSIVIGTPGFMPPEQAAGKPVFASDLYSLGFTAIYMLTGKTPQEIPTSSNGLVEWDKYAAKLGFGFSRFLYKVIPLNYHARYANAKTMLQALEAINFYESGADHLFKGELDQAIADISQAIKLEADPPYFSARSLAYSQKDECDLAIADLDQVIKLDPSSDAYRSRGMLYNELKKYDLALDDLTEAIRLEVSPIHFYMRAHIYYMKGIYEEAIADVSRAIESEPTNDQYYSFRSSLYSKTGDIDSAITDCNQAIRLNPNIEDFYTRGSLYEKKGNIRNAISDYRETLERQPRGGNFLEIDLDYQKFARENLQRLERNYDGGQAKTLPLPPPIVPSPAMPSPMKESLPSAPITMQYRAPTPIARPVAPVITPTAQMPFKVGDIIEQYRHFDGHTFHEGQHDSVGANWRVKSISDHFVQLELVGGMAYFYERGGTALLSSSEAYKRAFPLAHHTQQVFDEFRKVDRLLPTPPPLNPRRPAGIRKTETGYFVDNGHGGGLHTKTLFGARLGWFTETDKGQTILAILVIMITLIGLALLFLYLRSYQTTLH